MSEKATAIAKTTDIKKAPLCSQSQRTERSEVNHSPWGQILFLQNTVGNQAVQRLFKSGHLQAELKIGPSNDIYEQEADRVADQVMSMPDKTAFSSQPSAVSRGRNSVQMKPG